MKLNYNQHGTFRICQLTDLHFGKYPFNDADQRTLVTLKRFFIAHQFDLVVITGDLNWGKKVATPTDTLGRFYRLLNQFDFKVAITYGNHDSQGEYSRFDVRKVESLLTHPADKYDAFTSASRESYALKIFDHDRVANVAYVFDSGAYSRWLNAKNGPERFAAIEPEQVAWFNNLADQRNENNFDVSFFHIPLPEYQQAAKNIQNGHYVGKVRCPVTNSGLFYSFRRKGNVKALFCGHDHNNNFSGRYCGIDCNYGNVSGYNADSQLSRGARVIELTPEGYHSQIMKF